MKYSNRIRCSLTGEAGSGNNEKNLVSRALIGKAEVLHLAGRNQDSLEHVNDMLTVCEAMGNHEGIARAHILQCTIYGALNDFQSLKNTARRALKRCRKFQQDRAEAAIRLSLGHCLEIQGEHKKAMGNYASALAILKKTDYYLEIANCYNNLGSINTQMGNTDKSMYYYSKSLKLRQRMKDIKGESESLNNIAYTYEDLGDYDKAYALYRKALALREQVGYKNGIAITMSNIGFIYRRRGNFQKAREQYEMSRMIFEEIGNQRYLAVMYNNIGNIHFLRGEYDAALNFNQQALKIHEKLNNIYSIVKSLTNSGRSHVRMGRVDSAEACLRRAHQLARKAGMKSLVTPILLAFYEIHVKKNEAAHAYRRALQALRNAREFHQKIEEGRSLLALAHWCTRRQPQKARDYYQEAIIIFQHTRDILYLQEAYHHYGQYLLAASHLQEGRKALRKAKDLLKNIIF